MNRLVTYFICKLLGFVTFCNKVLSWHQCFVPPWVGRYNKTLNDWSHGKQWVLFPLDLNVPRGTLRVWGKQNSLFPSGPVIKCSIFKSQNRTESFDSSGSWLCTCCNARRGLILFKQMPCKRFLLKNVLYQRALLNPSCASTTGWCKGIHCTDYILPSC